MEDRNSTQPTFNPFRGTAQEHLDWCVYRAMEYADAGDMPQAWASLLSDVGKHEGTAHIGTDSFSAMAMVSGLYNDPVSFRKWATGWNVSQS